MKNHLPKLIPLVIIVILFLAIGSNAYYILGNEEQAVVERFGELHQVVDNSGLNFKIPLIDRVYIVNTNEIYSVQYGYRPKSEATTNQPATYVNVEDEAIVLTKGSYLVNIGSIIQYRITDAASYIYNVDDQIGTLRLAFESVLRQNMQNKDLENALVNKDSIASEILPELARKVTSYDLGITITEVKFTDVLLPESVQLSYDDVNNAKNEKTEYLSRAAKYENEMLPKARAEAYQLIQEAEGYKAQTVAEAKGEVTKFVQVYEQYKNAQDITKERLYIETMETVLERVQNKYLIDFDASDNTVKYLPLSPDVLKKEGN